MRKILFLVLCLAFSFSNDQTPRKLNSVEIHNAIKKLNFLGSVLYIAAHPDDENTRLISYFANEIKARTGYLSITRGDGGQNLIGSELKELLGIIRTQELLAARKIDGGEQLFSRAIDFGYTKTPEEALEFWGQEEILSDIVWALRTFKPDVIINRFDHRTSGETHGQHTASAILSMGAFDLAKDPTAFPEQLEYTETFEPKRLFFNTSPWFYGSNEEFEKADKSNLLQFDTGVYFSSMGLSNPEIAALSRSEHQSQGFGSTGSRGEQIEYLEFIDGSFPEDKSNLFAGIDTSWNRIQNGAEIGEILTEVEKDYNFKDPAASLSKLVQAYKLILDLEDAHWRKIKTEEIKNIITAAAGLYLEANAVNPTATPSEELFINLEAINRSNAEISLVSVELEPNNSKLQPNQPLLNNVTWKEQTLLKINGETGFTSPYWLKSKGSLGLYTVEEQNLVGLPESPISVKAYFRVKIEGEEILFERPVVYKYNDPVKGEVYQPFEILPPVSVKFREKVLIFAEAEPKTVPVIITAGKDSVSGKISLKSNGNWKIKPEETNFNILKKGESVTVNFKITPPEEQDEIILSPILTVNGKEYSGEIVKIDYNHILLQTLVVPAETKVVKLSIEKKGENIAYIDGAGDVIPENLEQIGYKVSRLDPEKISAASLSKFDAVVLGIRAYNTVEALQYKQPALLKYVENGGTVIVQYNVNRGLFVNSIAPYKLDISRDRVTEEDAEVRFIAPNHPILNSPNKISSTDFDGWVQERGLYFPDSWDQEFIPVLSMNDANKTPKDGSLLVAKYGKGYFIYTGLSFFRQFPEGVPGAYRLFANMISIGK
ncbi:PIG-L family deacetylase [Gillisia limnaea]|uniref:LmbE family protein n=1 Tax=Gillisia limnaea (strain DSM 15749 / LMG 21470 / R-8282) TaxID=865937 RepID=H2BR01_GILLR|nr:PIG-L family deacetylase [Gillisia limnaea]EHQ04320.1 LmbE family protein [Gillisia limnaea DSM 15749]